MQKIKIKINIDNLNAILQILKQYEEEFKPQNLAFKVVLSISDDIHSKLMRKAITERKNDKLFTVSFKYHEAYAIEAILRHFISEENKNEYDIYIKNSAQIIANNIHKQL